MVAPIGAMAGPHGGAVMSRTVRSSIPRPPVERGRHVVQRPRAACCAPRFHTLRGTVGTPAIPALATFRPPLVGARAGAPVASYAAPFPAVCYTARILCTSTERMVAAVELPKYTTLIPVFDELR